MIEIAIATAEIVAALATLSATASIDDSSHGKNKEAIVVTAKAVG